eukprot:m.284949 g.284949  ORF g.284949 m.284949 type:complete len:126 (+) comp19914_c0_seq9:2936-3313(+)
MLTECWQYGNSVLEVKVSCWVVCADATMAQKGMTKSVQRRLFTMFITKEPMRACGSTTQKNNEVALAGHNKLSEGMKQSRPHLSQMMPRNRNISSALFGKGTDAMDMKKDVFWITLSSHGTPYNL